MRFHITDDGPKKCSAQAGQCPITKQNGGQHYTDLTDAYNVYEKLMNEKNSMGIQKNTVPGISDNLNTNGNDSVKVKHVGLSKVEGVSRMVPQKHKSYYGMRVNEELVAEHVNAWINELSEEASDMEQAKIERDGGYSFHITVLSPKETRQLRKSGTIIEEQDFAYTLSGIGQAVDGEKEAWYIVVKSDEMNNYRNELGLPPKDFHITLGFKNSDVHTMPKDDSTLKFV